MIRHLVYTRERLATAASRLWANVWAETITPDELLVAGPVDRIPYDEAQQLDYRPAVPGDRYGPLWATYWFRLAATVPAHWAGRRIDLLWATPAESALWIGGRSAQGLTGVEPHERSDATVLESARGGEHIELALELACNGLFGKLETPVVVERCELALFDEDAWKVYFDFEVLRELELSDAADPGFAGHLRAELNRFCNESDPAILTALYEHPAACGVHEMIAVGHAHIDTAWLWPLAETQRKVVRTFATQTRLKPNASADGDIA